MKSWKQILPYLLLNIVVSALTTLAILWGWERNRQTHPSPSDPEHGEISTIPQLTITTSQEPPSSLTVATPTLLPLDQKVIEIENVFGVGDINNEVVRLKRLGEGELSLAGWQLRNQRGNNYIFPNLTFITGAIEVYTRVGIDTVIELHWGREQAAWRAGEMVQLFDSEGNLRASYQIP